MLSQNELTQYKKQLEALLKQYDDLAAGSDEASQIVELDQSKVGRLSRMDALQAQAMSQEQHRRAKRHIKEIYQALVRVEHGDFGWCEECGEAINPKRLAIEPTVLHCIICAESLENQ